MYLLLSQVDQASRALQVVGNQTFFLIKNMSCLAYQKIDLNRIVIISSIALSCLAIVASIYTASFLALSLSCAFCSMTCFSYKINLELTKQVGDCTRLQNFVTNEEARKKEHGEKLASLELTVNQLNATNAQLQGQIKEVVELAQLCDKAMSKATDFSQVIQTSGLEVKNIQKIADELGAHKSVLSSWIAELKPLIDDHKETKSADKIVQILEGFKQGQHQELTQMLEQLRLVKDQFVKTQDCIEEQRTILSMISRDIQEKTKELLALHTSLAEFYQKQVYQQQEPFLTGPIYAK